jgi:hypothetical protein
MATITGTSGAGHKPAIDLFACQVPSRLQSSGTSLDLDEVYGWSSWPMHGRRPGRVLPFQIEFVIEKLYMYRKAFSIRILGKQGQYFTI